MNSPAHVQPEDWARHKGLIMSLYETKSLKETMRIMQDKHQFRATGGSKRSKMYKYQLQKWGARKNLTVSFLHELDAGAAPEVGGAGGAEQRRMLFRGREINKAELQSYVIRRAHRNKWNRFLFKDETVRREGEEDSASTGSTAFVTIKSSPATSPLSGTMRLPDGLCDFEKIFYSFRSYAEDALANWAWMISSAGATGAGDETSPCTKLDLWTVHMTTSSDLLRYGHTQQGFRMLEVCLQQCADLIKTRDPRLVVRIFRAILPFLRGHPEVVRTLLRYVGGLSTILHGGMHPLRQVAESWHRMDEGEIFRQARPLLQCYYALLQDQMAAAAHRGLITGYAAREIQTISAAHLEPADEAADPAAVVSWLGGDYYHTADAAVEAMEGASYSANSSGDDVDFTRFNHRLSERHAYQEEAITVEEAKRLGEFCRATFGPGDGRTIDCLAMTSRGLRAEGFVKEADGVDQELEVAMDYFCQLNGTYSPATPDIG
ncbi:hypothetical protein LQW54_006297 [Pestalotiopsis sp. IQ-011]